MFQNAITNKIVGFLVNIGIEVVPLLGLDLKVLFHGGGYDGKSAGLISTYGFGIYPCAYGLQQIEMTATGETARNLGVAPFPNMIK